MTCGCYYGNRVCSLKQQDPAQRARFPHFGPKFRYSGRTQHEAQGSGEGYQRTIPKINRKASTRFIGAKEQGYNVGSTLCVIVLGNVCSLWEQSKKSNLYIFISPNGSKNNKSKTKKKKNH